MRLRQQRCYARRHCNEVWRFNQLQQGSAVFEELGQCHLWYTGHDVAQQLPDFKRLSIFLKKAMGKAR